jgi:hypothetical protein
MLRNTFDGVNTQAHRDDHLALHRRYNRRFDVSDFDDIHAAVTAAIQQGGGTVYLPAGTYTLTEPLIIETSNVQLVGDGRERTIVLVDVGLDTDGIVFRGTGPGYIANCGVSDMTIRATTRYQSVRDLLVLQHVANVPLHEIGVFGAGRYCVRLDYVLGVQAQHCDFGQATLSPVWVGSEEGSVSTTATFVACSFRVAQNGPGADVAGLGINFLSCTFESNGENGLDAATGITIRSGYAALVACYFENNASHDALIGTEGLTEFVMTGFHSYTGPYTLPNKFHLVIDQHTRSAALCGGRMTTRPAIMIHPAARNVHGSGIEWASWQPIMTDGSSIYDAAGVCFIGSESSSGRVQALGRYDLRGRFLQHTGSLAGFYGAEPVPQPVLTYSRAGESVAEAQIRAALVALGLVSNATLP